MIKYIANEPSSGLIYIQKHTQDAVPNVVSLSNRVSKKSREATLHAEDLEDSVTMVSSMKEHGLPIVDEMIKDVASSLTLISSAEQLKQGSIDDGLDSSFSMRRTRSWGPKSWGYGSEDVQQDVSAYFSKIIKKASSFKWTQLDSKGSIESEPQKVVRCPDPPGPVASASTGSILDMVVGDKASRFKWPQLESKEPIETEPQKVVRCPAPPGPVASASTGSVPDIVVGDKASHFKRTQLKSDGSTETQPRKLVDKLHEEEEVKVETDDSVELSDPSSLFVYGWKKLKTKLNNDKA